MTLRDVHLVRHHNCVLFLLRLLVSAEPASLFPSVMPYR